MFDRSWGVRVNGARARRLGFEYVEVPCAALRCRRQLADGARLKFDVPLVAGVSVAGIALLRKAPFVVVVILAAAVAAGLRAF